MKPTVGTHYVQLGGVRSDSALNKHVLEGPGSELYSHTWTEFPDVEITWDYLEDDKAGMVTNPV